MNTFQFTRGVISLRATILLAIPALLLIGAAAPGQASLLTVDLGPFQAYRQSSSAAPTTASISYVGFDYTTSVAGEFTSATVTYPGSGSPQILPTSGTNPSFQSAHFTTVSAYQAAYPFGTYTFTLSNGGTTATESVNYAQNLFPSAIPAYTAATYNALQDMNAANSFTVDFNSFTANPLANGTGPGAPHSRLQIFLAGGALVFDSGTFSNTLTSVLIPANTLQSGSNYQINLRFYDSAATTDNSTGVVLSQQYIEEDQAFFTTATPEPSTVLLLGLPLVCLAAFRVRRRCRPSFAAATRVDPERLEFVGPRGGV